MSDITQLNSQTFAGKPYTVPMASFTDGKGFSKSIMAEVNMRNRQITFEVGAWRRAKKVFTRTTSTVSAAVHVYNGLTPESV